jgi:hypothetical protein
MTATFATGNPTRRYGANNYRYLAVGGSTAVANANKCETNTFFAK